MRSLVAVEAVVNFVDLVELITSSVPSHASPTPGAAGGDACAWHGGNASPTPGAAGGNAWPKSGAAGGDACAWPGGNASQAPGAGGGDARPTGEGAT